MTNDTQARSKGAESGMQRINDATLYGADVVRELPSSACMQNSAQFLQ